MISGVVKSVEDHGYVIDVGKKSCRAFLPKNNTGTNSFDYSINFDAK